MTEIAEIKQQAEQFVQYYWKHRPADMETLFQFWADGKEFNLETLRIIRLEIKERVKP